MPPVFKVDNDGAGWGAKPEVALSEVDRITADRLRDWLMTRHAGPENGINVSELALHLHINERKTRTLITNLRERGWSICGTPETGYFWPRTRQEAEQTLAFFNARIRSGVAVRDGIRQGLDHAFGELDERAAQMELEL